MGPAQSDSEQNFYAGQTGSVQQEPPAGTYGLKIYSGESFFYPQSTRGNPIPKLTFPER